MKKERVFLFIAASIIMQSSICFANDNLSAHTDEASLKNSNKAQSVNKPEFDTDAHSREYRKVTKDGAVMQAMELMKNLDCAQFSYKALMGNNLTKKPVHIEFKNLADIDQKYASFEALGWKNEKKNRLYIYINEKHRNAPPEAIAALLSHEALHQDTLSSLNEETYAWTMEAGVWIKLAEKNPKVLDSPAPLVTRENMLKKLFEKGDYTNKYIKRAVFSNPGYKLLPTRSPGFEDEDL